MLAIKTPLRYINELRKILMEREIIARNYKILTENRYGYIPIKEKINNETLEKIKKELTIILNNSLKYNLENNLKTISIENLDIQIIEKNLEEVKKQPTSISEQLKGKLQEKEIEDLKTSFDIIGDIVILEIPENLKDQKQIIGEAALNFTKRKSIFMKKSAIEGITRTRQLEHIAGDKALETIHKEHGARFKLDVSKVYFSPRLATERKRIAKQVKDKETILDMFAGIGPFSIIIAKEKNVDITAADINKSAIEYMEENIKLNKLKGRITPVLGDVNQIAKEDQKFSNSLNMADEKFQKNNTKFDRIIMNLPGTAKDFLDLAISLINDEGTIHYYEFSDSYDSGIKRIKKIAESQNKEVEVLATRKVKSSRPGEWHIVIDVKIKHIFFK